MATAIQISNIALNNIGDGTITSFDDPNARARACKLRFEDVRDAVLRAHPWNCMTGKNNFISEVLIILLHLSMTMLMFWIIQLF